MKNKLKQEISKYLNKSENIFFHRKGRVSLYALLKSMNVKPGDEIIIPAFTCVVVPNPIIYLGAKPIYVDIDPLTFNMNFQLLESAITSKTRVIICQNTFGLSSNVEEIIQIAKKNQIFTIEDCTHGFGGTYKGKPNGSFCDASFFSTQWNKPFSTGLGGFALVNNPVLISKMLQFNIELSDPSKKSDVLLKILFFARRYFLNDTTYWIMRRFYRWLSKNNLIIGSSNGEEITSVKMPTKFFSAYTNTQAKEGIRNLKYFDKLLALRKINAEKYTNFLKQYKKNHVPEFLFENHSFLKYPLLVTDRKTFFELAEKRKVSLGDWFISPIHPVENDWENWFFEKNNYPISVDIAQKIINLPTEVKNINKILDFLHNNLDLII